MQTKSIAILVAGLALLFALPGWARPAAEPAEPGQITVSGEAEIRVVPDEVILTLGVETWNLDLEMAKSQNDERVRRVLALAQSHGVAPQHIQIDHISIEPRYDDNWEKEDLIGYFVRKNVVVTLKDIAQFDPLLTDVLAGGANYVHGIQFRTTELRKYRDEARALAIRAAREKAEAMVGELGHNLGRPRSINEEQANWFSWYNSWWGARWGGSMSQNVIQEAPSGGAEMGETMAPGQITVKARVGVTFEID